MPGYKGAYYRFNRRKNTRFPVEVWWDERDYAEGKPPNVRVEQYGDARALIRCRCYKEQIERDHTMTIERDEWLYVHTASPERARKFFGLPPETEVREVPTQADTAGRCFAVRAPKGIDTTPSEAQL